ncbi:MAG: hypothetical protein WC728_09810 [Elusimicrobiota bacterium]
MFPNAYQGRVGFLGGTVAQIKVNEAERELAVTVASKECPAEDVRFAAYLYMDRADPLIEPTTGGLRVRLRYRAPVAAGRLREEGKAFVEELRQQRFQGELLARNGSLHEYVVRQALSGAGQAEPAEEGAEPELSAEEEKELDRLIAEVEELVEKEAKGKPKQAEDPLGIRATWEEAHGEK